MVSPISWFIASLVLAISASASPAFTGQSLQITNMTINALQGNQTTLEFQVHDPEPVANVSTTCVHSWPTGPNVTSAVLCKDNSFISSIGEWQNMRNFTLEIQHSFEDDSIGQAPWNQVVSYARATVNSTYIWCVGVPPRQFCTQRRGSTIYAPVYAAAA